MKNFVFGLLIVIAVLGACIHGVVTGTGLVGWLNAAQQSVFGSYSMKLSWLLSLMAFATIGGALYAAWSTLLGGASLVAAEITSAEAAGHPKPARTLALVWGVMVALVWVIGLGLYAWSQHQDRVDAQATYQPLQLQGGPMAEPKADHLALSGRALFDRVVVHSRGKAGSQTADYRLVPLAPPDWQPGQAVSFIAKVRSEAEITGRPRWQPRVRPGAAAQVPERPPLLVRLDGSVPVPAVQAFKEIGVPLASRAWLVHVVPSVDGRPDMRDESREEWTMMLTFCSVISGVLILAGGIVVLRTRSGAPAARPAGT